MLLREMKYFYECSKIPQKMWNTIDISKKVGWQNRVRRPVENKLFIFMGAQLGHPVFLTKPFYERFELE